MTKNILRAGMFALFVWTALSPGAGACACIQPTSGLVCQSSSTTVFAGRVARIDIDSSRNRHVFFEVTAAYRGMTEKSTEVLAGSGMSDCDFSFTDGESYLIFASVQAGTGKLETNVCSGTRLLSQAQGYIDLLGKADPTLGFGIIGRVFMESRDSENRLQFKGPAAGITVIVSGVALRKTVVTRKDGSFEIWGLQPGSYRVSPSLGEEFLKSAQNIKVGAQACEGVVLLAASLPRKNP
ncbi:MAG TPA: hypothetical protein VGZ48_04405 [Candidatus Acidoferrales bacterium]|jgi:hypothetical protein|nr:hypothetical protein [Candidatus Acidoferrales bacterium]